MAGCVVVVVLRTHLGSVGHAWVMLHLRNTEWRRRGGRKRGARDSEGDGGRPNISPEVSRYDCVVDSFLNGPDGPAILRAAPHFNPGGLQGSLADCGKIIAPCIAHSLCAIAGWRWMVVNILCTRR